MAGKLIVFEGTDGSGKSTQFQRLCSRLEEEGTEFRRLVFPQYDKPSSALLRMYLKGEFGTRPSDVNPYAASTFYAVDRYASWLTGIPPPTPSIRPASSRKRSGTVFSSGCPILNLSSWACLFPTWFFIWICPQSGQWLCCAPARLQRIHPLIFTRWIPHIWRSAGGRPCGLRRR